MEKAQCPPKAHIYKKQSKQFSRIAQGEGNASPFHMTYYGLQSHGETLKSIHTLKSFNMKLYNVLN